MVMYKLSINSKEIRKNLNITITDHAINIVSDVKLIPISFYRRKLKTGNNMFSIL